MQRLQINAASKYIKNRAFVIFNWKIFLESINTHGRLVLTGKLDIDELHRLLAD